VVVLDSSFEDHGDRGAVGVVSRVPAVPGRLDLCRGQDDGVCASVHGYVLSHPQPTGPGHSYHRSEPAGKAIQLWLRAWPHADLIEELQ
jgi:hypothetical protein